MLQQVAESLGYQKPPTGEQAMTTGSTVTDEAVEAVCERIYLTWRDSHEESKRIARRDVRAALEAAAPLLAPQSVDREVLLIELNEAAERNDFGKFLEDDDFEALTRAVEKVVRPMPTAGEIAGVLFDYTYGLPSANAAADAVLALLNGRQS